MRGVYGASTLEETLLRMDEFEQKWSRKYPYIVRSWRNNWEGRMTYFRYPFEMRKLVYTTNIIESVNSKFRKVTDGKRVFPSDQSLLKSLYLAVVDLEKKWSRSAVRN